MNIGLSIRAFICRSSTAAVSLAEKNPAKYCSFANKLISAKNSKVESLLFKAIGELQYYKSTANEAYQLSTVGKGGFVSSAVAKRAAASSVDWLQNQMQCKHMINRLGVQKSKYDGLANTLASAVVASQMAKVAELTAPVACRPPQFMAINQLVEVINPRVYANCRGSYSPAQPSDYGPVNDGGYDSDDSRTWE